MSDTLILVITVAIVFLSLSVFITLFVIVYQRRQLNFKKTTEELRVAFKQELLQTQLEIQEQTLKNISQEIHDNIGQGLSLAKLNINTMDCNDLTGLQDKINTSKHFITKAIQDLRDLSKSLHTDYVAELGLIRAIEYELEMIKKTGNYTINFDLEGKSYRLEAQQELIIFRIVQEALHNIIRHARATLISVQFNFEPGRLVLQITDNGIGFDTSQLDSKNYNGFGLGLRNMYNRANIIHADFKLTSEPRKGTTVFVTLELNNAKS